MPVLRWCVFLLRPDYDRARKLYPLNTVNSFNKKTDEKESPQEA